MIRCGTGGLYILILAIVVTSSAETLADEIGTIILKSGVTYEDVSYEVNNIYKVIKIETEGKEINLSFLDIETVYDEEGRDITADVLGKHYRAPGETWQSQESEIMKKGRARTWKVWMHLGGNYSIPSGDYYDGIEAGFGFGGSIHIAITNQLAVQGLVSKSGMKPEDDQFLISYDPDVIIPSQKFELSAVRYMVAAEYYQHIDKERKVNTLWYIYSGLGAVVHHMSVEATIVHVPSGAETTLSDSDTESKFILSAGFGIVQAVSKEVGITLQANFDLVHVGRTASDSYGSDIVYAYIFDIKVGLAGFLN